MGNTTRGGEAGAEGEDVGAGAGDVAGAGVGVEEGYFVGVFVLVFVSAVVGVVSGVAVVGVVVVLLGDGDNGDVGGDGEVEDAVVGVVVFEGVDGGFWVGVVGWGFGELDQHGVCG